MKVLLHMGFPSGVEGRQVLSFLRAAVFFFVITIVTSPAFGAFRRSASVAVAIAFPDSSLKTSDGLTLPGDSCHLRVSLCSKGGFFLLLQSPPNSNSLGHRAQSIRQRLRETHQSPGDQLEIILLVALLLFVFRRSR